MYTQIFKEILLKNKYDQKSMEDLVAYCRQQYDANRPILNIIAEFEREYNNQLSIWWYTRSCFTYEMLNRALRNLEADTILKMGFFIHDLHSQIKKLHFQQFGNHQGEAFTVYRGQGLPESDFEKLMKSKGGLISFNNFLSTSIDRSISFMYAESNSFKLNTIGILFDIRINPSISSSPFARIDNISYFNYEGEVLFSMHTVFRIGDIKQIENNTRLWRVELELTDNKDQQLSKLTDQIRQETLGTTGYERLGKLLIKIGQTQKAEELYQVLLDQTFDQHEKSVFYLQIGDIRDDEGRYENAISSYEKALEIEENHFTPDQSKLGAIYMNIGLVYMKMGEHTKAAQINEKGVEILQKISSLNYSDLATSLHYPDLATSSNHPDLTTSYIDVGETNNEMGEYSKALSYQEQALEITRKTFPPNHLHLAASYNNIGVVYHNMREYSKALSFYEKAHEIFQRALPPNHPSLATSYNNIGSVYKNIGEYSKAFSYHEKSLAIRQKALSPNHPDLAISYTNIGMLYEKMREHSKARSYLERAIEIFQRSLPPNHPDLQAVRNNIELVNMKPQVIVND
jgi:tetratricopeptide (TPR) repeat protein